MTANRTEAVQTDAIETDATGPSRSEVDKTLRAILRDVLGLDQERVERFDAETGLFGHLPELDSMAVAGLLTELEDRLEIEIDDDDVDAEIFETFGNLVAFAEAKQD